MSTVDDPQFLLRHLRTCFITSDDSGLCELLVEPDLFRDDQRNRSNSKLSGNSQSGSEYEVSVSPDIIPDMDYGGGRIRSNTALRIEKIKEEKSQKSKVKSIKWKHNDPSTEPDEAAVEEMFSKKELIPKKLSKKSSLSALLRLAKESDLVSTNPFDEYKQFNGESHVDKKSIEIYMTMEDKSSSKALPVVVVTIATVRQTIGLACWKYTCENRKPELTKNMELYSLNMMEDDGQVDEDFPPLDHNEPISKFGFTKLALVMKSPPPPVSQPSEPVPSKSILRPTRSVDPNVRQRKAGTTNLNRNSQLVTIHIPDHGSTKLVIDVSTVTVKQLAQTVQERRNLFSVTNEKFQLGNELCQKLDDDMLIEDTFSREFYLTCSRTKVGPQVSSVIDSADASVGMMFPDIENVSTADEMDTSLLVENSTASSSHIKSYPVHVISRVINSPAQLIFTARGIEVRPVSSKSPLKSLLLNKTIEIDSSQLLTAIPKNTRSNGKSAFSVHFILKDSTTVRQHYFEATDSIVKEIVDSINELVDTNVQRVPSLKVQKQRRQSSMY